MSDDVKLVLVVEEDDGDDKIEISTAERVDGHMIPIATISIGYNEPMESLQRRYADQIVQRWNSYDAMKAALSECQTLLADLTSRSGTDPSGVAIITFYARCVEMETKARAVLSQEPKP